MSILDKVFGNERKLNNDEIINNQLQLLAEKDSYIRQLITKVVQDGVINPDIKVFLKDKDFFETYAIIGNHILKKVAQREDIPSIEYLEKSYRFIPKDSTMTQQELGDILKQIYIKEHTTLEWQKYQDSFGMGILDGYRKFIDKMQKLFMKIEPLKLSSSQDEDEIIQDLEDIQDEKDRIYFGLEGIDDYENMRGHLIGFLGGTGSGKSYFLQKLTAMGVLAEYNCLHFCLELQRKVFWRRFFTAIGWIKDSDFRRMNSDGTFFLNREKKRYFAEKLSKYKFHLSTLDKEGSEVDLAKIEKAIQVTKPDVVFIDHVQHIEGNWNPMESDIAQKLSQFAIIYNCLIIMSVQTNDEGSNLPTPPEFKHIEKCKNIKNPCDLFVGLKGLPMSQANTMRIEFVTRKSRHGKWLKFIYWCNVDTGVWTFQGSENFIPKLNEVYEGDKDDEYISKAPLGKTYQTRLAS